MTKPLRADAERNRRRILVAADELFAARGLEASLDDVAAAAGVGVGTVYRRFPDKDALVDALFEDKIREVESIARAALEIQDEWGAFSWFMYEVCRLHATDRGLKDAMLSDSGGHERARHARDIISPVGGALLRRAQEAGEIKAGLDLDAAARVLMVLGDGISWRRTVDPGFDPEKVLPLVLQMIGCLLGHPQRGGEPR